ncbi:unnamed protein product [Heterobilharzia americana]|nr:unnamed protein product [Heterobilharzia americana]CAH8622504.1 unnamed protein product [Heterobilharzia americana]
MSKKARVQFIQNEEPSFIRQFKERAGIPADATIESKHKELTTDNGEDDRPDEQPQLVYDPCSEVDELEARAFIKQWQYEHKLGLPVETNAKKENLGVPNRIMFRSAEERCANKINSVINTSNVDNFIDSSRPKQKCLRDRSPIDSKRKDTKCSLLSFDLDEDEG